ncbi:hypothetical protein O6H91_14G081700 [Diphasiastrum complanatum]|uniref:Uncharacterized protein n=1 Tax=Diphasiastrum complanatum TaxID=34168 RepID=A0ACC2BS02_DIPCM|nr:hypothetical protein O6H91_14G081700 [Diphasiastrum complanatum]
MDLETLLQLEFCCWMQQAHSCGPVQSHIHKSSDSWIQFDNRTGQLKFGLGGLLWLIQLPSGYRSEADPTGRWKRIQSSSATTISQAFRVRILGASGPVMSCKHTASDPEIIFNEQKIKETSDWKIDLCWAEPGLRADLAQVAAMCEKLIQSAGTLFDVLDAMESFCEQYVRFADEKDAMLCRYLRYNVEAAVSRCKISSETVEEVAKAAAAILSCLLLQGNCEALAAKLTEVSFGYGSSDESATSSAETTTYGKLEMDSSITMSKWKAFGAAAGDDTKADEIPIIHTQEDHALANEYEQLEDQNVTNLSIKKRKLSDAGNHIISNKGWGLRSSSDYFSLLELIKETDVKKFIRLSDEFRKTSTSTVWKMAKVKAIRDGKVLHWCNIRGSWQNNLTIDISLDLPSFMDNDLTAVANAIGLNKDQPLYIKIIFQKHSSEQSISLTDPAVIASQPYCKALSSSFAISYLLPHIVRQYLEQQLKPSLVLSQKNCFTGLLRYVVKYLACLTSICVVCGLQLGYVPSDDPRVCSLTICQARFLSWSMVKKPAASSPQPAKIAKELELSYWDYYDSDDCTDGDQLNDNLFLSDKSDDSIGKDEAHEHDITDNDGDTDMETDAGHAATCSALRSIVADAKLMLKAGSMQPQKQIFGTSTLPSSEIV